MTDSHSPITAPSDASRNSCDIAWIGWYPAHYVRQFHREVERRFPGRCQFVYVQLQGSTATERSYETGDLPRNATVTTNSMAEVWRLLRRLDPRAVVTAGYHPFLLIGAVLWAKLHRRSLLYWADTNLNDILQRHWLDRTVHRLVLSVYFRMFDRIMPIGGQNRAFYRWCGVSLDGQPKVPYPHDPTPFERAAAHKSELRARLDLGRKFTVLFTGRLIPLKRVDQMLHAIALVPDGIRSNLAFVILGGGPEEPRLRKLSEDLKIGHLVQFVGAVASDQVADLVAACDVFLFASDHEAWGLVANEAMSAGLPGIISTNVGSASDLVVEGQTGIRLSNPTPAAMAEAITELASNPERTARMGMAAQRHVRDGGWTVEGALAGWESTIRSLLQDAPSMAKAKTFPML